jgi:phosphohistidine phosphatase
VDLFVIRHAEAAPRESWDGDDRDRPLTPRGRDRIAGEARALRRLEVKFDRLLHSPWLRAVQTADALARLAHATEVTALLAGSPTNELLARLTEDRVAVVGHEPWLSELVAWLAVGKRNATGFALGKGAVAWLVGEPTPAGMRLHAVLPASVLRRQR